MVNHWSMTTLGMHLGWSINLPDIYFQMLRALPQETHGCELLVGTLTVARGMGAPPSGVGGGAV